MQNDGLSLCLVNKLKRIMETRTALFPGSFDPFTLGHANIVERALALFDEIVIAVGINEAKRTHFSLDERLEAIRRIYAAEPRVKVAGYDTLTMDFARKVGAKYIVRGLRSVRDFEYERDMADFNRRIGGIETILLFAKPEYEAISSSAAKELFAFGKDISWLLPKQ